MSKTVKSKKERGVEWINTGRITMFTVFQRNKNTSVLCSVLIINCAFQVFALLNVFHIKISLFMNSEMPASFQEVS